MNSTTSRIRFRVVLIVLTLLLIICGVMVSQRPDWQAALRQQFSRLALRQGPASGEPHHDVRDHHDDHEHHDAESNLLELSMQARQNLGLNADTVKAVEPTTFRRSIPVPAIIVGRPGRTKLHVAAPLTGVVQHVQAVTGEAVAPASVLFQLRLTHEDLVQTQTEFLQMLGELDVEQREVRRLESVTDTGAIPGKTILERQYSRDKLLAQLIAKREALRLHGLSDPQIAEIEKTRHLLRELTIFAPALDEHRIEDELHLSAEVPKSFTRLQNGSPSSPAEDGKNRSHPFVLESLFAQKGQSVSAGDPLCALADYHRLFIEGRAFEQDAGAVSLAAEKGWPLTALIEEGPQRRRELTDLNLKFVSNSIDPETRMLAFYVDLPNEIVHDSTNSEDQRFVSWRYRIGQRLQLLIPVEEWTDQLVVPVQAVVQEGPESYVFQRSAGNFLRVPVHVKYRDQQHVVIANDGLIKPGTLIALRSAHQMQMALKNKAGGGIDPHAGHHH